MGSKLAELQTTPLQVTLPHGEPLQPGEQTPGRAASTNPTAAENAGTGRHALLMVSATVIVALLNYALNIVLGWSLPVDQYGRIGVSQTLIFVCLWLVSAGFPWVVTRSLARAHEAAAGSEQRAEAWRTYKTAWVANAVLTSAVAGLLLAAFYSGWLPLERSYAPLILIVAATVTALGVGSVPNAGLQGLFRFGRISALRVVEAVVNIIASVALVILGFGVVGALAGFAISAVLAALLAAWAMRDTRFWQARGWGGLNALRTALPMTLAVFGGVLLTNVDLLSVKFLSSPASSDSLSGAYQVAAVLARAPLFIGTALVSAFYPRIAQNSGNLQAGRDLVRWVVLAVLPANVILAFGAPAVVLFFFPERYASSGLLLAVLALGSACLVVASALASVLQARHRVAVPAVVMTGAVVLQVGLLVAVVPVYGALAAALVSAGASALAAVLLALYCRHLDLAPRGLPRYAAALALLAVPTALLTLLFKDQSRLFVSVWVAGCAALYLLAVLVLNLLDVRNMAEPQGLRRMGLVGAVARRALSLGAALNRLSSRLN